MGTYLWAPDELQAMRDGGNALAKKKYGGPSPRPGMSYEEIDRIARDKYDKKLWYKEDVTKAGSTEVKGQTKKIKNKSCKKKTPSKAVDLTPNESNDWDWDDCAPLGLHLVTGPVSRTDAVSCVSEGYQRSTNKSLENAGQNSSSSCRPVNNNKLYDELAELFGDTIGF